MKMRNLRLAVVTILILAFTAGCNNRVIFNPDRTTLYSQDELWKGFDAVKRVKGFDGLVYDEYIATGKFYPNATISRLRSAHDEGIAEALRAYVHDTQINIVGVMGSGSSELRCTPVYEKTVRLAWWLARERKYLIATGGGPGQMEAANLGAYLADQPESSIDRALKILRTDLVSDPNSAELKSGNLQECSYNKTNGKADEFAYTAAAKAVIAEFPKGHENLGVPTWFYGNEPPNVFATHVAKFFSNGMREEELVKISMAGMVIAPGSAGTRQEIFMDMTKNNYFSFCFRNAVVFFGVQYYGALPAEKDGDKEVEPANPGVYALVHKLSDKGLRALLTATDEPADVLSFLQEHPPRPDAKPKPECSNAFHSAGAQ